MIKTKSSNSQQNHLSEQSLFINTVEIDQAGLLLVANKISTDKSCRYKQLALRLLIYVIGKSNGEGSIAISARRLSKEMDVHYNTITKCLKYLRQIGVLRSDQNLR
jgi:hypothetical protein